jgi:hypothetical protein
MLIMLSMAYLYEHLREIELADWVLRLTICLSLLMGTVPPTEEYFVFMQHACVKPGF